MNAAPALRLHLAGLPRLMAGDQALRVGTRKALALLALLALHEGASRERLAAWLWPEVDGPAARRNLRRELFRLRELGVPLHEQPGGALALDAALAADAQQLLDAASAPPLDGLDGVGSAELDDWLQATRHRLTRQWRQRALHAAQAAEAAGDFDTALARYGELHEADPLREITVRDLMRVHLARGQRNAALQVFEAFARRAHEELAVAPLPETLALAHAARSGSPAPAATAAAAPAATFTLPRLPPFVGRAAAERSLHEAWAQGRLMLVAGEAGEGKSRLIAEVAAVHGAYVHVACRPADRGQPYAAAARLLRELRAAAGDTALPDELRSELARVLPELGSAAPLASSAEQQQFFDACARGVLLLAADNFCALAVDDAHNADAASLALLLSIAQRGDSALRFVFAHRASETPPAALAHFDALVHGGAATRVALGPLDGAGTAALVQALSGSAAPRFAARLHQATGGNPFFLFETLRHLFEAGLVQVAADGLWETPYDASTSDYHELPVPPTVRDAVRGRVARLGEDAMHLLEAASLLGGPFTMAWLAGSTSLDEAGMVAALEAAEAAHLLAPAENRDGSYRFAHDLVPQSLAAGLSPARAGLRHRQLALALEAAQGSGDALAQRIARHWESAHEPRRAIPFRIQAGLAAARLYAHAAALAEFDAALAHGPDAAQETALRHARMDALRHLGDVSARGAEAEALMALAQRLGDRNLEADAAVQRALALADASHRREALRVAEHAVALQPDNESTLLRALRVAGWAAMAVGEAEAARGHLRRAIPIAERIDAAAACSSLSILLRLACDAGDFDEARRLRDRAWAHPGLRLRPMIHQQVLSDSARLSEAEGQRSAALRVQRECVDLAERAGAMPSWLIARFNLMRMLFNGGELAAGRELALAQAALATDEEHPQQRYMGLSSISQLAAAEGRWAEAVASGRDTVALCDALDDPLQRRMERVLLARAQLQAGAPSDALQTARAAQAIEADGRRVLLSAKSAEIDARLALGGDRPDALLLELEQALVQPKVPEEERQGALHQAWLTRGRLLLALGRAAEAAAAVEGVDFTAELQAQAQALRLQAGPAPG